MLENMLAETFSLNGEWEFVLGEQQGTVAVPGAWEVQGYADLEGPAVYRREFDVPASWDGARVMLRFGAVSYYVEVVVNGERVGTHEGLWTPFEFDVSSHLLYGQRNTVELHVTKPADEGSRFPYRAVLVGFIPYISTTFGGVWQDVELVAHRAPALTRVSVAATLDDGIVKVDVGVWLPDAVDAARIQVVTEAVDSQGNKTPSPPNPLSAPSGYSREYAGRFDHKGERGSQNFSVVCAIKIEQPIGWSPSNPALYTLRLSLQCEDGVTLAQTERRFGFRQLKTVGERVLLNDETIFLRGALSWGWNPATLAPVFTDDELRTEFRRLKAAGFNLYKLCLYVPPPNLFHIADEEGMLLWLEMPMWLPRLSDHLRQQAVEEYGDILARVHHHPSVLIYSLGCELSADMADADLLQRLDALTRGATCGALVCDNSGSGEAYGGLAHDYADFNDYHFYCDLHYFTPLCDHFRRDWRPPRPWIFGEFCDCDDFRDTAELAQDDSYAWWGDLMGKEGGLHRWAYPEQAERIANLNLPFSSDELMRISRQTSFVVRKFILETVRKRRDIGGYVVTGLRDTPISTSGVFDDLGRFKWDIDAFRQFNDDAVLLLDQGRARRWTHGGDRPFPHDLHNHAAGSVASFRLLVSNIGASMAEGELSWALVDGEGAQVMGETRAVNKGSSSESLRELVSFEVAMPQVERAAAYRLEARLTAGGQTITNAWKMWVYPQVADTDDSTVLVTSEFTAKVEAFVRDGGRAIVVQPGEGMLPVTRVPFWRESIKLLYEHPVMNAFPHDGYADLQFYHMATDCALDTEILRERLGRAEVKPVMQRLDARLFTMLDYLVEVELGQGRMFMTTLRLWGGAGDQVIDMEASPAARFLVQAMADYLRA